MSALIDSKKIGIVIREYRESRKLTQEVLSGLAGLDRTHYSKIERGVQCPGLDTIFKIADALDVPPHEIVSAIEKALDS